MKLTLIITVFIFLIISCKKKELPKPEENSPDPIENSTIQEGLDDGDFESWTSFSQGAVTYMEPSSGWWGTLNKLSYLGSPITVSKDSLSYKNQFSAKLETKMWGSSFLLTGILAAGYFDENATIGENLILGRPYDKTPLSLNGYFKYISVNNDSAGFYANLTKYNISTQQRDTIAEATFVVLETVNSFTLFEIPFEYYTSGINPDTINVVFTSSAGGKDFLGQEGSTLYVDDVYLELSAK